MFSHRINLHTVHRQDEPILIKCINELEQCDLSEDSDAFLSSLDRPLQNEECSVHLFARNLDVDIFNYNKLQQLQGDVKVYSSTDEGSAYYLNKLMASKKLGLKLKSPVMLIKNLSDELVNGTCGEVVRLHDKSVDVKFKLDKKELTVNIVPVSFSTFDPVTRTVLAQRIQLPLKLAYAFTIHKSQGRSLPNVTVHCEHIIQPGQLGVAVGRAISFDGLKVVNYKKSVCRRHPEYIYQFYESFTVGDVKEDLSCCRNSITTDQESQSGDNEPKDSDIFSNESDFSDVEIDILENILPDETCPSVKALNSVLTQFLDSPAEQQVKSFQSSIQQHFNPYDEWYEGQFSLIEGIGRKCFPEEEGTITQKHRNEFFIMFNEHINSEEFTGSAQKLLKVYKQDQTGPAYRVIVALLFYLEQSYIENLGRHLQLQPPRPLGTPASDVDLDSVGRGKIRYVSGYVLAKLKYNLSKSIRNALFVKGKEEMLIINQAKMEILNSLCCSYDEILATSTDSESLEETQRKQNLREGLTNITDEAFDFFQNLEVQCREKLTHENLVKVGKSIFNKVKEELLNDLDVYEKWLYCVIKARKPCAYIEIEESNVEEVLSNVVMTCDNYRELFKSVIDLFLKVSLSQFRRDYLAFLKNEKGKSLRKKVIEKSKAKSTFSFKFFEDDNSVNKEASYLRLKSELLQNQNFLEETSFSVKELLSMCKNFDVKVTGQKKKSDIVRLLVHRVIVKEADLPHEEPQPGTSGIVRSEVDLQAGEHGITAASHSESVASAQPSVEKSSVRQRKGKGKAKGKGKGKKKGKSQRKETQSTDESDEKCAVCNQSYKEGEDWISCDLCLLWYHRECMGLQDEDEWVKYSEEEEPFTCPMCL